jgi:hypothetical protein
MEAADPDPSRPGWAWSEPELAELSKATARLVIDLLTDGRSDPVTRRPPRGSSTSGRA